MTLLRKKQFWGALVGIALLAYCAKDIRGEDLRELALRLNYYYAIPAFGCSVLYVLLRAARWRGLVSQQRKQTFFDAVRLFGAGSVFTIAMPALTGQVGRLLLFARQLRVRKTFMFSCTFMEVLFDAVSLIFFIMFTSIAFVFPEEYRSVSFIIAAITGFAVLILYLMLHFEEELQRFGVKRLRGRWPGFYVGWRKFIRNFTKGIRILRSGQHMAGTLSLSLLAWFAHLLVIYFLFVAFGFELPFAASAVVMIVTTLVLMIPITPGNAGMFEFAVTTSLAAFSISRSDAILYALTLHIIDLLPLFLAGAWYLKGSRMPLKKGLSGGHPDAYSSVSAPLLKERQA